MIPKNIYITHASYKSLYKFEKQIIQTSLKNPTYKINFFIVTKNNYIY